MKWLSRCIRHRRCLSLAVVERCACVRACVRVCTCVCVCDTFDLFVKVHPSQALVAVERCTRVCACVRACVRDMVDLLGMFVQVHPLAAV